MGQNESLSLSSIHFPFPKTHIPPPGRMVAGSRRSSYYHKVVSSANTGEEVATIGSGGGRCGSVKAMCTPSKNSFNVQHRNKRKQRRMLRGQHGQCSRRKQSSSFTKKGRDRRTPRVNYAQHRDDCM